MVNNMKISLSVRNESFEEMNSHIGSRQKEILDLFNENTTLTAWQISDILNRPVYQVRPRITELEKQGLLSGIGSSFQERTSRNETIYRAVNMDRTGQLGLL